MVAGKLGAVTTKLSLDTVALLTVTAADPELVALRVSVFVVPATTLPKSMLGFASDKVPTCCWVSLGGLPALNPWQAAKKQSPERSMAKRAIFQELFALSWAECSWDGEFGVIGGHEPSPPTAKIARSRGRTISSVGQYSPIRQIAEVHTF